MNSISAHKALIDIAMTLRQGVHAPGCPFVDDCPKRHPHCINRLNIETAIAWEIVQVIERAVKSGVRQSSTGRSFPITDGTELFKYIYSALGPVVNILGRNYSVNESLSYLFDLLDGLDNATLWDTHLGCVNSDLAPVQESANLWMRAQHDAVTMSMSDQAILSKLNGMTQR